MGGFGSGRKRSRKSTVEECRQLDIARFPVTEFTQHSNWPSIISWKNYAGEVTGRVGYTCEPLGDGSAILHFSYTMTRDENKIEVTEQIPVRTTRPFFGGIRWWFICPAIIAGKNCQLRVRKLYIPPGGRYFACRICYNLTYESVRTHDGRVSSFIRNPGALMKALNGRNPNRQLLALTAAVKVLY